MKKLHECKKLIGGLLGAVTNAFDFATVRNAVLEIAKDDTFWDAMHRISSGVQTLVSKGTNIPDMVDEKIEDIENAGRKPQ